MGAEFMTVQTYELLIHENYELLLLMDEEGDTGPSRHRNLIVGRLNSALYHLGSMIKDFHERKEWPLPVVRYVSVNGYADDNRQFVKAFKGRWESEWKESFDDEDPQGYRMRALETYLKYGNAFGIKGATMAVTESKEEEK